MNDRILTDDRHATDVSSANTAGGRRSHLRATNPITDPAHSAQQSAVALETRNLTVNLGGRDVLKSVSVAFETGRMHAVLGPNGCGKTTLVRALSGSLKPASGEAFLHGQPIRSLSAAKIARTMAVVWQGGQVTGDLTVKRLISYGRYTHVPWWKQGLRSGDPAVERAMELTGVSGMAERRVASLSGGERQRVWIATALAQDPSILVLDEPTTYLDIAHQLDVLELVRSLNEKSGITVVTVLHDLGHAARFCDRILVLGDGQVRADGPPESALSEEQISQNFEVDAWVTTDPAHDYPVIAPRRHITERNPR